MLSIVLIDLFKLCTLIVLAIKYLDDAMIVKSLLDEMGYIPMES